MARIEVRTRIDMLNTYVWYGDVESYSSRHVTISAGLQSGTYLGSFSYDGYGNVYGRLTGYETRYNDKLEVRVSGVDLDAYWVMKQLDYGNASEIYRVGLSGDDGLFGAGAADLMRGYGGHDRLFGGGGNDRLMGDDGNDRLQGDAGNDFLAGGTGFDTAAFAGLAATRVNLGLTTAQNTGHGLDTLVSIEAVVAGAGADLLIGNAAANGLAGEAGNDQLFGGGGNDSLLGGLGSDRLQGDAGNDRLDGGAGMDTAVFAGPVATRVSLAVTSAQNTGHGWDTLVNIENVVAGAGADVLAGNGAANILVGNAGNDRLNGGGGNDRLDAGVGNDYLIGGAGGDLFVFKADHGNDRVADFQDGADRIMIVGVAGGFPQLTVSDAGADAVIRFGGTTVTLEDLDHRLIGASDFVFV